MKGIILLNGEPYIDKIDSENAYVICADGAYDWAKDKIEIDENIGDFDSVKGEVYPKPKEIFPSEKNSTDGEIALFRMLELKKKNKIESVEIYGGGGKREDHFLGNLHLLFYAEEENLPCKMVTNNAVISMHKKSFILKNTLHKTISLLPFGGEAHIINSRGLYYPLENLILKYGSTRGVSNVAIEDSISVEIKSGVVLAVVNTKDVK